MTSFVRISALLWADILVVYAFFEMQNYLTGVWELGFTHAAGILNVWGGISMILPVFFLFLVDAFLGHFQMLMLSSVAYSVGIGFVSMSTPPVLANSTDTCKEYQKQCVGGPQKVLFYIGMSLIAIGMSGHLVSIEPFLEEQKNDPEEGVEGQSIYKMALYFVMVLVPLVGAIALPYIKPWSIRFGLPAICTLFTTLLFFTGWDKYKKQKPLGSPLTKVCRVFVASAFKQCHPFPFDDNYIHKKEGEIQRFSHTRILRCLEKAAIIIPDVEREEQLKKRWRLCSVGEVEEGKIAVRLVPMWLLFITCGIVSSFGTTYFVEQANHMNRKIGKWKVPLQILLMLSGWARCFFDWCYRKMVAMFYQGSKKYAAPTGMAFAMVFSVLCCITAAKMEIKRLGVIRRHDLLDKPEDEIPMSVYWLLFQFVLLAGLDSFFEKSVVAFYDDQAPKSMEKYFVYFTKGISGLGFMFNVLSIHVVGEIKPDWFQHTLNRSRLDRYYWLLAALSSVNLVVFIMVASCYRYKDRDSTEQEPDEQAGSCGIAGVGCCFCCCS